MKRENCWKIYDENQLKELEEINSKYRNMLDSGKTERECVELL